MRKDVVFRALKPANRAAASSTDTLSDNWSRDAAPHLVLRFARRATVMKDIDRLGMHARQSIRESVRGLGWGCMRAKGNRESTVESKVGS
jgi:hypothetical protein